MAAVELLVLGSGGSFVAVEAGYRQDTRTPRRGARLLTDSGSTFNRLGETGGDPAELNAIQLSQPTPITPATFRW
jgi:hypothetical protein